MALKAGRVGVHPSEVDDFGHIKHVTEPVVPITLTASDKVTINKSNCFRIGNYVHIYARLAISAEITSATTYGLVSGLPAPKNQGDNGFGLATYTNNNVTSAGNAHVDSAGKITQGITGTLAASSAVIIELDYYI